MGTDVETMPVPMIVRRTTPVSKKMFEVVPAHSIDDAAPAVEQRPNRQGSQKLNTYSAPLSICHTPIASQECLL
jgi:hypothetical protein